MKPHPTKKYSYPLLENGFSNKDINEGIKVLKSKFITMGKHTLKFEKYFAKKFNSKYAVMVNSGSSANLLSVFASKNPLRLNTFKSGDEALIPSLCWSTSLWPLVQAGLIPKFIDINPKTLNVDVDHLISKITKKTKLILLVNVLGSSTDLKKIATIAKRKKIILIEDNCESLGGKQKNKFMGTFGDFGTFSFFYSHQITSGEGGMILCNNQRDYEILVSLRSHGWSKGMFQNKISKRYPKLDPRYIFYNSGFNLRPLDIQAAIGFSQLRRFNELKNARTHNKNMIIQNLTKDKRWKNQFEFIEIPKDVKPSFMVLPILLNKKFAHKKKIFIDTLEKLGIETRPIISGSFVNQPSAKLYKLNKKKEIFRGAQLVQDLGFVIGLHTKKLKIDILKKINDALFSINKI
ncbi:aminotransferase class I/II-fold pyridoxal phosphate-dependent enzyme [Candidatus Pelagibacter sp.]|nr:aminotransferase class I/II-fold pyridoxal phosphate-dependent enzyme [Candidatus Pelagibacter sp.]